jgi:tetratricopeptide (TPR) repeat protein
MAYIRQRGNQVLIVHGHRDPHTGKVVQRTLFAVYSKGEAADILGPRNREFRAMLREQFPQLTIDWRKIERGLRALAAGLPETYEPAGGADFARDFRRDLTAFARKLILASPQYYAEGAEAVRANRHQLDFLRQLVEMDQEHADCNDAAADRKARDLYWRFAMYGNEISPDVEEMAESALEKGDLDRAEAVFSLLVEAFDHYADGYNHLGSIARERGDLEKAIAMFRKAASVGRNLFPKRIARSRYWSDLKTRPYIRALRGLTMSMNEAGRYEEAMAACERLEKECQDDISSSSCRASIHLNLGRWALASSSADRIREIEPSEGFVSAFAWAELGHRREALAHFLHAALNRPVAARVLMGAGSRKQLRGLDALDYNTGIGLLRSLAAYLDVRRSRAVKRFFRRVMADPRVSRLLEEIELRQKRWEEVRPANREDFDRMTEMRRSEFAEKQADGMVDLHTENRFTLN